MIDTREPALSLRVEESAQHDDSASCAFSPGISDQQAAGGALLRSEGHREPCGNLCVIASPDSGGSQRFAFIRCLVGDHIGHSTRWFDEPRPLPLVCGCRAWCGMVFRSRSRQAFRQHRSDRRGRCPRGSRQGLIPVQKTIRTARARESQTVVGLLLVCEHLDVKPGEVDVVDRDMYFRSRHLGELDDGRGDARWPTRSNLGRCFDVTWIMVPGALPW